MKKSIITLAIAVLIAGSCGGQTTNSKQINNMTEEIKKVEMEQNNTPKEITYTSISGDKSQSKATLQITLEKTVYNYEYRSKEGKHIKEYEAPTPLDVWINLSELFDWNKFAELQNGKSEIEHDGMDRTIFVKTESGAYSVTNYGGDELREFFSAISSYLGSVRGQAIEKTIEK